MMDDTGTQGDAAPGGTVLAPGDVQAPREEGGAPRAPRGGLGRVLAAVAGSLPALFMKYERLCEAVASRGVHNLGFFLSTAFLGPVGLYVWESREGRGFLGRAWRGLLAWAMLLVAARFLIPAGLVIAAVTLVAGRPLAWLLRATRLARTRPAPGIPPKLTFEIRALDVASLLFISLIFLVMVANRDELARLDGVSDSDPAYHMAVAKQILDHKGRLPRWDRWEYAPFGRPHLYHPGLHYLIALFSWKSGDVLHGFNTVQMLLYPLALLGGWYFARWLFGAACGFLALIFLSMETTFLMTQASVLPAAVVTAMIPLILMAFLARRTAATVVLLTVALYMHGPLGVPELVILGLLVFSMRHREWFPFFRKVTAFAGLLYLPWVARMLSLDCFAWFGSSVGAMGPARNAAVVLGRGILQLQFLNPVLLILALRTWRRDGDGRLGVVKALLLGFLPMLLAYGGRYFMHTWPLWAILVARNFEAWLSRPEAAAESGDAAGRRSLRRRTLAFCALAFVPLPVIAVGPPGGKRRVHVWPGITGLNAMAFVALHRSEPDRDFERLAAYVRRLLPPSPLPTEPPWPDPPEYGALRDAAGNALNRVGQRTYDAHLAGPEYAEFRRRIVHIGEGRVEGNPFVVRYGSLYLGDRLAVAAGCATDTGGWGPEVRCALMAREVARAREAPNAGLFLFFDKGAPIPDHEAGRLKEEHSLDWTRRFGPHYILGGRGIAEEPDEVF